jgi:hypothetical protein
VAQRSRGSAALPDVDQIRRHLSGSPSSTFRIRDDRVGLGSGPAVKQLAGERPTPGPPLRVVARDFTSKPRWIRNKKPDEKIDAKATVEQPAQQEAQATAEAPPEMSK